MIYGCSLPAGAMKGFGDGLGAVFARMLNDPVLLSDVLRVAGDPGGFGIGAGDQRGHVGRCHGRKDVGGMFDANAFGDELFEVGWMVPFDVIGTETVGGEEEDVGGFVWGGGVCSGTGEGGKRKACENGQDARE